MAAALGLAADPLSVTGGALAEVARGWAVALLLFAVQLGAGRLVLGRFAGVPLACLEGRVHLYEGVPAGAVNVLPRTLKALGCEILILTNAAGSLRAEIAPGSIALIQICRGRAFAERSIV